MVNKKMKCPCCNKILPNKLRKGQTKYKHRCGNAFQGFTYVLTND